ncbi:MAG: hypothetical protein NT157_04280 [Candidatus Micrarchaeota archaeon]|nr:hypothetical protein [Candidatus Micrarchaeota archaeon]
MGKKTTFMKKALLVLIVVIGVNALPFLVFKGPTQSGSMVYQLIAICGWIKTSYTLVALAMFIAAGIIFLMERRIGEDKREWASVLKVAFLVGGVIALLIYLSLLSFISLSVGSGTGLTEPPNEFIRACSLP